MTVSAPIDDPASVRALGERVRLDGFVVLQGLCGADLAGSLLEVSRQRSRLIREALGTRAIGIGSAAGYDEIVQRSPGRWDIPVSPEQFGIDERQMPWWPLIASLLGDDAEHSYSGVVFSDPGSPAQHWHTDSPHESAEHRPPHAINVLVALHDISMEMGPTECARGSQLLTNHLSNPSLVREQLIYQHAGTCPGLLVENSGLPVPERCASAMSKGSCLVFDDRLMHRGMANHSQAVRYVAYFSYRLRGYFSDTHFEAR